MADTVAREHTLIDVDRAVIRFAGDSGDGMQLTGRPLHHVLGAVRQRPVHPAGLPGRDPGAGRDPGRRLRLPGPHLRPRHPHPGRPPERAGGDEPGGPQGQPRRPHRRRAPSSSTATPSTSGPCTRPATRRNPLTDGSLSRVHGVRGADDLAHPGGGEALGHQAPRRRAVQELLRPRPHQLAVHPPARSRPSSGSRALRQDADGRRGQHPGVQGRLELRRDGRAVPDHLRGQAGPARARHLHQHLRATPPWPGA